MHVKYFNVLNLIETVAISVKWSHIACLECRDNKLSMTLKA